MTAPRRETGRLVSVIEWDTDRGTVAWIGTIEAMRVNRFSRSKVDAYQVRPVVGGAGPRWFPAGVVDLRPVVEGMVS